MIVAFQTNLGVARAKGSSLDLLEVSGSLESILFAGGGRTLASAKVLRTVEFAEVTFEPPVRAKRFIFVGLNYASHAEEVGYPAPTELMFGVGAAGDSPSDPDARVQRPQDAPNQVDYEGEIAVVVGKRLEKASPGAARTAIAAIVAANDLTARDVQMQALRSGGPGDPGITGSKLYPGFKPIGPGAIILEDGERLPADLELTTHVNGELRQSARVAEMIFPLEECLARISQTTVLDVGDVVLTGTPAGVGFPKGKFLQAGDEVAVKLGDMPPLLVTIA